ncbi:MAG: MBL fold metallo-hydrolase [Gammaproteobacteria bacterium]
MRFASLGSGSRGNATLVEQGNTCILVDCGFTLKEIERRLARLSKDAAELTAILITHEHADHVSGVAVLARKYGIPVWMTPGTWSAQRFADLPTLQFFSSHETFAIDALEIQPFPVPHDAREPSQFVFANGAHRLGLLTDTGSCTPYIETMLNACDALLIECNHDSVMLAEGSYSPSLKYRVGGSLGHLSNAQAAHLLTRLDCSRLQHLVAMHLSEKNNTPALARQALCTTLDCEPEWIGIADQHQGLAWRAVG